MNQTGTGATGCVPSQESLCLFDGRFEVQAEYRDYGGNAGTGKAVLLTPDTGYFWFFNSTNVEAVAKMVSFCGSGTNNVGFYAGGLTDVEVKLKVKDTLNGTYREYTNPLGRPFDLVRDGPFACAAQVAGEMIPAPTPGRGGAPPVSGTPAATASWKIVREGPVPTGKAEPASPALASCVDDDTTVCLYGGRFKVKASYKDYSGASGVGHAVKLTPDTGYFWFFSSSNVEAIAKIVNFCGSATNNYGIYAGGMTDLEVHLYVTDTEKGTYREYVNPLGKGFSLLSDGPFQCP